MGPPTGGKYRAACPAWIQERIREGFDKFALPVPLPVLVAGVASGGLRRRKK
jgi:hypothetical protein